MITSKTWEFHAGDRVTVFRDCSYGAAEDAYVVEVRADRSLRLEFGDGHRSSLRNGHVELCEVRGG
ncbi:hypothetical protein ABT095_00890 [Kitasatospora sp. NPDC002227]|uniref:hypothetical protein n=1 Tax=Kitasatospora sp. NPDC002227 TaxID=3154773 RepID=UPI00332CD767